MAKLHRSSTPDIVTSNIARNIAAGEFRPTSATLRATNFFLYPLSATFRAIMWRKFQCSANQILHLNLTADSNVARRTFHINYGLPEKKTTAWSATGETTPNNHYRVIFFS